MFVAMAIDYGIFKFLRIRSYVAAFIIFDVQSSGFMFLNMYAGLSGSLSNAISIVFSKSFVYLPSWLTLNNGVLNGTPISFVQDQTFDITLTVSDPEGSTTTNNFSLLVIAINNAPVAYDQSSFTLEDNSIEIDFTGYDSEGDVLSYVIDNNPLSGVVSIDENNTYYDEYTEENYPDRVIDIANFMNIDPFLIELIVNYKMQQV